MKVLQLKDGSLFAYNPDTAGIRQDALYTETGVISLNNIVAALDDKTAEPIPIHIAILNGYFYGGNDQPKKKPWWRFW